jgi:hypothetical protein
MGFANDPSPKRNESLGAYRLNAELSLEYSQPVGPALAPSCLMCSRNSGIQNT